ncbi:AraC family transcriptional regulator [Gayadomonas joobiniege]|uniref:AraC family transcriptional regulator n=1 Tax=Gayadomonas joobiniege TaxID=1234606 RepID=UPI000369AA79|nr:AraC family transcriptional regulator [Gayadomonas joobiniege]
MTTAKVYCEPFCIKQGYNFEIHEVSYNADDFYSCFMHFHEVHEIIIFKQVEGTYFYSQGQSVIKNNDIVFTPCLETHDFSLADGAKSWYIIQFLPELLSAKSLMNARLFFQRGMHLRLNQTDRAALQQQVNWLLEAYQNDPHSELCKALLDVILLWLADKAKALNSDKAAPIKQKQNYQRLQPVIEQFRNQSAVNLPLEQAAELCHLSPSYFSRLFKSVFRCNYSEYVNQHKLYSAARLLSQSNKSVTEISYELDFSSPSHFIALFKKQFNVTPKKYKSQLNDHLLAKAVD